MQELLIPSMSEEELNEFRARINNLYEEMNARAKEVGWKQMAEEYAKKAEDDLLRLSHELAERRRELGVEEDEI